MIRAKALTSIFVLAFTASACSGGGSSGNNNDNRPPQQTTPPRLRVGAPMGPGYGMNGANTPIDPSLQRPSQSTLSNRVVRSQGDSLASGNGSISDTTVGGSAGTVDSSGRLTNAQIDQIATSVPTGNPDYDPNPREYVVQNPPSNSNAAAPGATAPAQPGTNGANGSSVPVAIDPPAAPTPAPSQAATTPEPTPSPAAPDTAPAPAPSTPVAVDPPAAPSPAPGNPDDQAAEPPPSQGGGLQQVDHTSPTLAQPHAITDPAWMPGLPRDPYPVAISTWYFRTSDNVYFSDGKADSIMAAFMLRLKADPAQKQANLDFAGQVTDVHLTVDKSDRATVYLDVHEGESIVKLGFSGRRSASGGRQFELTPLSPTQSKFTYSAWLMCMDMVKSSCENASIMLHKSETNGHELAQAYIIHRLGTGILTLGKAGKSVKNKNHKLFAKYMSDSRRNVCLAEKAKAREDKKTKLAAQLEKKCAGKTPAKGGAKQVLMRTWAVAAGGARYEIIFNENDSSVNDPWFQSALVIGGQLVLFKDPNNNQALNRTEPVKVDDRSPVSTHVSRASWFLKDDGVQLLNNDGAGALNIKFRFDGTPEAETRVSFTSNLRKTITPKSADSPRQNPAVTPSPTPSPRRVEQTPAPAPSPATDSSVPAALAAPAPEPTPSPSVSIPQQGAPTIDTNSTLVGPG